MIRIDVSHKTPSRADIWERLGSFLLGHQKTIRRVQWSVVFFYIVLLALPVLLPLADRAAYMWNNVTRFAQMTFWGVWWPFVLVSTMLVGRVWCGLLCPEGFLSEVASSRSKGLALPRWLQWPGWPTLAFAGTTLFGQMVSVYQYPKPAALILGGSTIAAMTVGYLYGRNKRVWCRYLCPVSGVFGLLAKVAPLHFDVSEPRWKASQARIEKPAAVNCAPMVALRTMKGNSACHMCGRCSGFRSAIKLARRSPNHEIVNVAGLRSAPHESALIAFGLMGLANAAFHWSASTWFLAIRQTMVEWLLQHDVMWPLAKALPWFLLTNYPERNDVMMPIDGVALVVFLAASSLIVGVSVSILVALANRVLGKWRGDRFHHLVQTLIPVASAGLFAGLLSLPIEQLRTDGVVLPFVLEFRIVIVLSATVWSTWLSWCVGGLYTASTFRRILSSASVAMASLVGDAAVIGLLY